jgi:hypothetical protein
MNPGFERERARLFVRAGGHCEAGACGRVIDSADDAQLVTLPGGGRRIFCGACRARTEGHRVRDSWRGHVARRRASSRDAA